MHLYRKRIFKLTTRALWSFGVICASALSAATLDSGSIVSSTLWKREIVPLFDQECIKCHGPLRKKGGVDLSTFQSVTQGGDSGTIISPGSPDESQLFKVLQRGADPHMPPKKQLGNDEIDLVRKWIAHLPLRTDSPNETGLKIPATVETPQDHEAESIAEKAFENLSTPQLINHLIRAEWTKRHLVPAPVCDDRTFVRRVYLDLVGRAPSPTETKSFLFDGSPTKRRNLITQLLQQEEFNRNMAENFDLFLLGRKGKRAQDERKNRGWIAFLEQALEDNRPWNELVRDLILARQPQTPTKPNAPEAGALWFVYEHRDNHQLIAESIAPIVFGTQIKCAQCHDHPLAHEIKQAHYWGVVAAFNRSKNTDTEVGIGVAESAIGGFINFANLEQESQPARLVFLNGVNIDEERPETGTKEIDSPENYRIAPPEKDQKGSRAAIPVFSRREQLAKATTNSNPLLARAFVNHLWALFLGRGIVHPFDEMNSKHPASHPELLHLLGQRFESSNYDVKALITALLESEVYQLSSQASSQHLQHRDAFPSALERPLKAESLYRQLIHATGHDESTYAQEFPKEANALKQAAVQQFPDLIPVEYQATLQQAMFLTNSPEIDHLLVARPGNAAHRLLQIEDIEQRIEESFVTILGRFPDQPERSYIANYLAARSSQPTAALKQVMWSLIATPEFQLNR